VHHPSRKSLSGLRRPAKNPQGLVKLAGGLRPPPPFHWRLGIFTRIPKRQKIKDSPARRPCGLGSEKVSGSGTSWNYPSKKVSTPGTILESSPATRMLMENSSEAPLHWAGSLGSRDFSESSPEKHANSHLVG